VSFADSPTTIPSDPQPTRNLPEPADISSAVAFTGGDEFSFSSDDDAFYAGIDLGEADLGRPIDFEEGLGHTMRRPHDESVLGVHGLVREEQANSSARNPSIGAQVPVKSRTIDQERVVIAPARAEPVRVPFNESSLSKSSAKMSNASDDRPHFVVSSSTSGPTNANQNSNKIGNETGIGLMNPNARMIGDNATTGRQKESNAAMGSNTSGASAQATKRPAASSMGGFNFPPGVVRIFGPHLMSCFTKLI
jgi:DNA repair and recombination protein RAD52